MFFLIAKSDFIEQLVKLYFYDNKRVINASIEVAQTSSSGYNNTAQFSTEMSF
jgi:hypothetical protein